MGDFELLEELGRGATGTVWLARQVRLNRRVALKLLALPARNDEEIRQRFEREAQAIAALHHPHIVQVYEVGTHEGRPCFAMEWIAGGNLSTRLREALPSTHQAAAWLLALAQAVAHAHSRGVVHRDLKPANILLDPADKPFLTDFGLAKLLGTESDLTLTGLAVSSAQYMAPEQAAGKNAEVGPPADIHALGAVLYHALTGRPPFLAETLAVTLKQVLEAEPVAPRKLNPAIPRDLETICLKCLEKLPSRRYASAQELAEDLERFLDSRPIRARPVSPLEHAWRACRRRPMVSALSAALVLAILGGAVGVTAQWRRREAAAQRLQAHLWEAQLHAASQQIETDVAGGFAAHAALLREAPHLRTAASRLLFTLGQYNFPLPLALLSHPAEVRLARFSPEGRHIATVCAGHELRLWDARDFTLRAGPRRLAGPVLTLQFSADGQALLVVCGQGQAELCQTETLQRRFAPPVTGPVERAMLSDDPRLLLVREQDGTASLWDTGRDAKAPRRAFPNTAAAALSPSGRYLAIGGTNQTVQVWDTQSGEPACAAWSLSQPVLGLRFAPDNRRVAIVMSSQVRLWHLSDPRPSGYVALTAPSVEVAFSPDGQRLLVVQSGSRLSLHDAVTGRGLLNLGRGLDALSGAAFTPDGLRILAREEGTRFAIFDVVTGRDTSRPVRLPATLADLSVSPDGRRLLAAGGLKALPVWDISIGAASEPTASHDGRLHTLGFSRNGRWLLTASADGTARLLDARTLQPAGAPLRHADPVLSARFSPDDERVLTASQDGTAQLWNVHSGEPMAAPMPHPLPVHVGEFSPDGKNLATVTADGALRLWNPTNGQPLAATAPRSSGRQSAHSYLPRAGTLSPPPSGQSRLTSAATNQDFNPEGTSLPRAELREPSDTGTNEAEASHREPPAAAAPSSAVCSGQFSPDGRRFVVVSTAGQAVLGDTATGSPVLPLPHTAPVTVAQFSPDGARLATACRDGWVRLWNPTNGAAAGHALPHDEAVLCLTFAPDGWRLATGGAARQPRLWDVRSGALLCALPRQESHITALAFSPDGRELATFTAGHLGRVWDTATGRATSGRFTGGRGAGVAIAFSPDGRWLACGMANGGVRLFEHPTAPTPVPAWLPELADILAQLNPATKGAPLDDALRRWGELRLRLQALAGDDFYARWGRWFAGDRASRAATPHSPLTVPQFVEILLQQNTGDSLHEAMRLMPDNPRCAARLAEWLAKNRSAYHPHPATAAAYYRRRAAELETLAKTTRPTLAPSR